jgi:hypothetical protein
MSEPLEEETETTWIEFLNRFETEIYPTLFEKRGYSKDYALMFWTLNRFSNDVAELTLLLKERYT